MNTYITRAFFILFLVSIIITPIYWLFFSNTRGFDEKTEQKTGMILNENFKEGDIIFPTPNWDIGFTRYLRDGIINISYNMDAYSADELADYYSNNTIFILLDNKNLWNEIAKRLDLVVKKQYKINEAVVIEAETRRNMGINRYDFVHNIMDAREVYFIAENGEKSPCKKEKKRWQCSRHEWNYVGSKRFLMGGKMVDSVWAHPRSKKYLHIIFDLPENATSLVFGTSFLPRAYNDKKGKPVDVKVKVDGTEILSYTNRNIKHFYRSEKKLPENAKQMNIQFYVENDGGRHFVFNGYVKKNENQ